MDLIHCVEEPTVNGQTLLIEKKSFTDFVQFNCLVGEGGEYADNDFELVLTKKAWEHSDISSGDWIYIPSTEWGGKVKIIQSTQDGNVLIQGPNFRSILNDIVISPLLHVVEMIGSVDIQGFDAYYTDRNDANAVLDRLITKNPIIVGDALNNVNENLVKNYSVEQSPAGTELTVSLRFQNFVSSIEKLLIAQGYYLRIHHKYIDDGLKLVHIAADPIVDYSETKFLNSDYNAVVTSTIDDSMKKDFLIGLGRGELEAREIAVFAADYTSNQLKQIFTGTETDIKEILKYSFNHNAAVYDYASAESLDELVRGTRECFEENYLPIRKIDFQINDSNLEFNLGDIVGGEDIVTGAKVTARVTQKELTIKNGQTKINYKVGDISL